MAFAFALCDCISKLGRGIIGAASSPSLRRESFESQVEF